MQSPPNYNPETKIHDLRLAIQALLQGDPNGFVVWFGVLCSTWSAVSRGSTFRWFLNPLGFEERPCVAAGNIMVARRFRPKTHENLEEYYLISKDRKNYFYMPAAKITHQYNSNKSRCSLLMALTVCLGGCFICEQPRQSILYRHPRFRWLTGVCKVPLWGLESV